MAPIESCAGPGRRICRSRSRSPSRIAPRRWSQIDLGLASPKLHEDEDDDVDMIPLIDVSLVLLDFLHDDRPPSAPASLVQYRDTGGQASAYDNRSPDNVLARHPQGDRSKTPRRGIGVLARQGFRQARNIFVKPTARRAKRFWRRWPRSCETRKGEIKVRLRAEKSLPIETIKADHARLAGAGSKPEPAAAMRTKARCRSWSSAKSASRRND